MTVTYHAGRRIQATQADFDGTPAVSAGWKEIGRTTLGSAGDTIDVSSLPDKRYYMVLTTNIASGTIDTRFRLGNGSVDTGSNYARRSSENGGSEVTGTGNDSLLIPYGENGNTHFFGVHYFANKSNKEKLLVGNTVDEYVSGAGNAPARFENAGKWSNTSDVIDVIRNYNAQSGSFDTGSEVVVLGYDPDDTHTDNFWEELASVDLSGGAADDLSSGTITAKKYLWVQAFMEQCSSSITGNVTFNSDTGSNYARRRSNNGAADSTGTGESSIDVRGGESKNRFENMFIKNIAGDEKLVIGNMVVAGSGAGTAPDRTEYTAKWANTSNQITSINFANSDPGSFGTKSFIKVWGHD